MKPRRPRDRNQLAKAIVDLATGKATNGNSRNADKDIPEVGHQRNGGRKGGNARAAKLTPEERKAIARLGAMARWRKSD